jgi:hypothetical protein
MLNGGTPFQVKRKVRLGGDGVQTIALTGNLTLTELYEDCLNIDPGGSNRDVTLAATLHVGGLGFSIFNAADNPENLVVKNSAGSTIVTIAQGGSAKVVYDGANAAWKKVIDVGANTGASLLASDNAWTGTNDISKALTGTDQLVNVDATINHATQTAIGVDVTIAQITNARTAGEVVGVKSSITSLTGSTAGVDHVAYDGACTAGDADSDHILLRQGANFSRTIDSSAAATGEVRWMLPDAVANALTIEDSGGNDFLLIDTAATDGMTFGNATTNPVYTFLGSGAMVFGTGTPTAGADMWATCPSKLSASVLTHEFFEDFIEAQFSATTWVVTEDDAAATQAVSDGQHGVLTLTAKAATDNDGSQVTWATETFKLTSGKKLWFEARIKSSSGDMTNSDWFVGLAESEDLTGVADNMPANGIGFHKEDGAATFSASSSDNGTNLETAAVGTIVDTTWIRIGLLFDGGASGAATITPYVDGVAGTPIASVTYATMAEMAPLFMIRNGDGVTTQTLDVDYVKVVAAR